MSTTTNLLQLHIELRWVKPKVWRRVLVPDSIRLSKLHRVIQAAMGWTDSHLHEFDVGGVRYGQPDPDWDMPGSVIPESKVTLKQALGSSKSLRYTYDFGDGWEHTVKVEKAVPRIAGLEAPICLAGKNACPPEDVGGPPGYAELLRTIADPNDPERENMVEWIGGEWDSSAFDIDAINLSLRRIR